MADNKNGIRAANIIVLFAGKEARSGVITFGENYEGSCLDGYAGTGFEFYAKYRETEYGGTYGGYVSPARLSKEDRTDACFYINLNPYDGDNDSIAYTLSITAYDSEEEEFGEKVASGVLYKYEMGKGVCRGYIFANEAAAAKKQSSKKSATSSRSGGKSGSKTKDTTTRSKAKQEDDDEVPY